MQGTTGTYAINGTNFSLPPSKGKWMQRDSLGLDGNNRPIYPSIREYEMTWELMPISDLKQIIDASLMSVTGTVVADLPKWGDTDFTFYSYSGTVFREPEVGEYFVDHVTDVRLMIGNIRTN